MSRGQTLFRALTLLLFLSSATLLHAQLNRGVMEGLVTDPQGAVMPGADITVTALDTNVTVSTKTNSAGYYRVVNLVPGKYRARFVAVGFSPLEITDIDIPAGQVIREDAQLKVGTTRTEVKVTAEAALIQTAASNFSTDVQTRLIQDMPLQGRDLQQLVFLLPGVNPTNGPPGSNFGFNSQDGTFPDPTHAFGSDVSVNGGTPGANAWYLDGNLNLSNIGQNIAVNPSPDAVSEFQAITNAFAAEYSSTEGGVFNVVLKSGANRVHGNVYEFVRNDATNARNPFTSIDALGQVIKDRQLRYNNFGGTLGGPVVLPHLYNGKNKTFFFFSWDTSILHLLGNQVFTVPTAAMRTGDFSEDPDAVSNGIWNPYSTVGPDANGLFERTAFGTPAAGDPDGCLASHVEASGGTSCNFATQIPATISTPNGTRPGLDPVAMFFMNTFPLPNYNDPLSSCPMANTGTYRVCDNYLGAVGSSQDPRSHFKTLWNLLKCLTKPERSGTMICALELSPLFSVRPCHLPLPNCG